jgi:type VI secretion system secreted protein VgrG
VLIGTYFDAQEAMSRLFNYRITLISPRQDIDPDEILGKSMTVRLSPGPGEPRYFNGLVTRFVAGPMVHREYRQYEAELSPWLWFLDRTSDCRIFENKKAPEIIEQIFRDNGFSNFDLSGVKGQYPKREYCVQYRETDLNFVSRLMEEVGIFYFFKHDSDKHTLVLADQTSAYLDADDKEVEFRSITPRHRKITRWQNAGHFRSGKWTQRDYNFKTPTDKLHTTTNTLLKTPKATSYELYDYPGLYINKGDGDKVTKLRMEEQEARYQVVEGDSDCLSFTPGYKFTMKMHAAQVEEGKTYVLTSVRHVMTDYTHISGEGVQTEYSNSFTCMTDSRVFRPPRETRKPVVHGPHTAFVTGPAGEEIHTDEYARIRAKFHWEREGYDSCWMRVSQSWAGKQWGTQFIPRVGMEVLVEFLEGDADRPIVVGCVYNADYMPPYALTGNKTQSGWKTRSTTGGGSSDFNELRFEDKKGQEEVYFHAEKDFNRVVENNDSLKVGMDKKMPGKQDIQIWGNRTTNIEMGNDNLTLKMGSKTTNVMLGSITYTALQSITLQCGASSITLSPASISIMSPTITLTAAAAATVTSAGTLMLTGTAAATLTSVGPCTVHGMPLLIG